jgi:hypothetical protein
MRVQFLTAVAVSALFCFSGALAPASAEVRLRSVGSVTYEPEPAAPEVGVYQIRPEDRRINSMRIEADGGPVEVKSLKVKYADGSSEVVKVRQTLRDGERSALFALEEPRPIRSVEITYVPKGAVTLILLADQGRAEPPPPPPQTAEWVALGCQKVGLLGDRDSISVSSADLYKSLRLRSQNYDIEMAEFVITYANGGRDRYQVRQIIPAGGQIGPIALRGEARRITQLDFLYRARTIGPFKTKLCVEGLRLDEQDDQDNRDN